MVFYSTSFNSKGMWCLLEVANHVGYVKPNFEGLVFKIWGKPGKYTILFFLVLAQISVFIGANIFICKIWSVIY